MPDETAPVYLSQTGPQTADGVFLVGDQSNPVWVAIVELDTDGEPVPVYKSQAFAYDGSNNVQTITVTDGVDSWVRTFTYTDGNQTGDSGWVKQ